MAISAFLSGLIWEVVDFRQVHNYLQGFNNFIYFLGGWGVHLSGVRTGQ
jgi:hypothetical protein